jgi:hypothetical protein
MPWGFLSQRQFYYGARGRDEGHAGSDHQGKARATVWPLWWKCCRASWHARAPRPGNVRIWTVDYLQATPVAPGEAHLPQALT